MNRSVIKGITLVLRFAFGALLIGASLDKMAHPFLFANAVENYRIVGEYVSYWIAVWMPYLELLTGILLIIGIWIETAVVVNMLLMDLFLVMVVQAAVRDLDIACGCFRMGDATRIGWLKLAENAGFSFGATALLILVWKSTFSLKRRDAKHPPTCSPHPQTNVLSPPH